MGVIGVMRPAGERVKVTGKASSLSPRSKDSVPCDTPRLTDERLSSAKKRRWARVMAGRAGEPLFAAALRAFADGVPDPRTLALIKGADLR